MPNPPKQETLDIWPEFQHGWNRPLLACDLLWDLWSVYLNNHLAWSRTLRLTATSLFAVPAAPEPHLPITLLLPPSKWALPLGCRMFSLISCYFLSLCLHLFFLFGVSLPWRNAVLATHHVDFSRFFTHHSKTPGARRQHLTPVIETGPCSLVSKYHPVKNNIHSRELVLSSGLSQVTLRLSSLKLVSV